MKILRSSALLALLFLLTGIPLNANAVIYPAPAGFVTDAAQMLSAEDQKSLEATLARLKAETGNEIAVVTIPSLEGEPVEDYAVTLFERWGIGQKEKDNGALILIARDDREMRIEVGYGLEPLINDAKAGRIIRELMTPAFQQEQYGEGIARAIDAISAELRGESALPEENSGNSPLPNSLGRLFPFLFFLFIYGVSYLGRSKRWWPGGVIGAIGGGILGIIVGTLAWAVGSIVLLGLLGLGIDYVVSKNFAARRARGLPTDWRHSGGGFWFGGGGGLGGGGFGGFGGGLSGGGGAGGRW